MRESGRPEVWEYASFMWPGQPETQQAFVDAVTDIEGAFLAVNRLPHGDDLQPHPLAEAQRLLNLAREQLYGWAGRPTIG